MLIVELSQGNKQFLDEIQNEFPACETVEVDSFGADSVIQILIPLAAILAPVISPVLTKALTDSTVTVKYDGIEVSGDYKKVKELIKEIEAKKGKKDESE